MAKLPDVQSKEPIHLAVGRGIEAWSWVELNLCILLEGLLGQRRDNLIGAAFYAVVNFGSKLEMVDAVAQLTLRGKRLRAWDALYERIRKKSKKRNEIAHFSIVLHGNALSDDPLEPRVHPYWSVNKGTQVRKNEGLTPKQLEERARSFIDLSIEILKFHRSLPKRLRRSPARLGSKF
jgi:hypothetical protein